ncbi:unnamed protein product [Amoebophrya sp. A25]|nr:unnamed protein product [Amoebophrya sp. A25]|eukprot:GSA25T00006134001.1
MRIIQSLSYRSMISINFEPLSLRTQVVFKLVEVQLQNQH